jgi:hypothetical protein
MQSEQELEPRNNTSMINYLQGLLSLLGQVEFYQMAGIQRQKSESITEDYGQYNANTLQD